MRVGRGAAGAIALATVLAGASERAAAAERTAAAAATSDTEEDAAAPAGELVVTARRRVESVQKVPIAMSVATAEKLEAQGLFNIQRLTQVQPSIQFYAQNPRNTFINIRGIGAPFGLTNDGFEQGVGIYVDDVFYNRIASATLDFVDVERIETLRGPQGTLYGKNTTAGALSITTAAPQFSFGGKAEVTVGNLGFRQGKASITGPLSDRLALRLSLATTARDGTLFNTTTNSRIQSLDNIGLRGALLWKASDSLDITLSGDWNRQDPRCCAFVYAAYRPTQRVASRQYPALVALFPGYAVPSTNAFDRITDVDAALSARNEIGGLALRGVWRIDDRSTLTSISAWRYWAWGPANDRDFTGLPIFTRVNNPTRQRQFSQEVRLNHEGERVEVVGGVFAFYQEIRTSGVQETGPAASRWLLAPTSPLAANPAVLNKLLALNDIRLDNSSLAAFGKLNWHMGDALTISPGLRVNYDLKRGLYDSVVTGTASNGTRQIVSAVPGSPSFADPWTAAQRGVQASQFFEPRFSGWNLSYDLNVSYAAARDINLYATYARAFKTAGLNLNGVPADANGAPILAAGTILPERLDHFELGIKSQAWGQRITLNVTGFWTDIRDFQANVQNGQFGVVRGYLANAEKVRSRGVEADFSIAPSPRFSAYLSTAFTDARYVRFCDAPPPPELAGGPTTLAASGPCTVVGTPGAAGVPGGASPPFVDASGQRLPGVSKWAHAWGAEANLPATLLGEAGQFYLGYDASYRSSWSSNPTPSAYTWVDGYAIHNLRGGFRTGRLDAFLWLRNALDKDYIDFFTAGTGGNTGLIVAQVGDPRTLGATIKLTF